LGTSSAVRFKTGWPMRAILRIAMARIWDRCGRGSKRQKCGFALEAYGSARDRHQQGHLVSSRPSKRPQEGQPLQIIVRDNNIDQALKALKKKMQREGIFREMKLRGHYEKPSEKRARERAEAIRRYRKLQRKRMQREGLLPK